MPSIPWFVRTASNRRKLNFDGTDRNAAGDKSHPPLSFLATLDLPSLGPWLGKSLAVTLCGEFVTVEKSASGQMWNRESINEITRVDGAEVCVTSSAR